MNLAQGRQSLLMNERYITYIFSALWLPSHDARWFSDSPATIYLQADHRNSSWEATA